MSSEIYFLLFLLAICLQLCRSKEGVIKRGTMDMWHHSAFSKGTGSLWYTEQGSGWYKTCGNGDKGDFVFISKDVNYNDSVIDTMYVDVEYELTTCISAQGELTSCYSKIFEVYVYLENTKLTIPSESPGNIGGFLNKHFVHVYNISDNRPNGISIKRQNHTFHFPRNSSTIALFAIRSRGACGKLYRMKMYYYYCEETFINSVKFENTSPPVTGYKQVLGKCSVNSSPSGQEEHLKALCYSNGTWARNRSTVNTCSCSAGYEPHQQHGCKPCQPGYFKPDISNLNCRECPSNSNNVNGRTSCECKKGFYNVSIGSSCYAPQTISQSGRAEQLDTGKVNISWDKPKNSSIPNDTIYYDVHCYSCETLGTAPCDRQCLDIVYHDGPYGLNKTFVVISKLKLNKDYLFRIYAKNSLNNVMKKEDWNYTEVKYKSLVKPTETDQPDFDKKEGRGLKLYYIIGGAAVLALIFLVCVLAFLVFRRKHKKDLLNGGFSSLDLSSLQSHRDYIDPTIYETVEDAVSKFTSELDPNVLSMDKLIGGGEFGDVYKGKMKKTDKSKIPVAIKTLKHDASPKSQKDFLLEASIMGQFKNANVVWLEGVVTKSKPRMIVLEYMSNGSLESFLKSNDNSLTQLQLIGMARGVAGGMKYLSAIKFVHRDLAARNILVSDSLLCKISDFGLARELDTTLDEYATSGGKIPVRWTAPEAISYRKFSSSSDVWSYGILLWEIFSFAERPYWDWDNLMVIAELDRGYRLPAPTKCPKGVHDLMLHCWAKERLERPSFAQITAIIDKWIRSPERMDESLNLSFSVEKWLESIKMDNYSDQFTAAGYKYPAQIAHLNDEDLKTLGITLIGHRNKILKNAVSLQLYEQPCESVDV